MLECGLSLPIRLGQPTRASSTRKYGAIVTLLERADLERLLGRKSS